MVVDHENPNVHINWLPIHLFRYGPGQQVGELV